MVLDPSCCSSCTVCHIHNNRWRHRVSRLYKPRRSVRRIYTERICCLAHTLSATIVQHSMLTLQGFWHLLPLPHPPCIVMANLCIFMHYSYDFNSTHTHAFNGPLSGTTRVSRYQKGKTSLDFTEARDSEWQWHLLGHMQVCNSLQTDNHARTPTLSFFTGRMLFLSLSQQRQSTES